MLVKQEDIYIMNFRVELRLIQTHYAETKRQVVNMCNHMQLGTRSTSTTSMACDACAIACVKSKSGGRTSVL
eukprot:4013356-Pleurochrysis_carterae.AAC.3